MRWGRSEMGLGRTRGWLALALLLAAVTAGCAVSHAEDIRATIEEYNELLPAAYLRGQPDLLANVASEAEVNRVLMYVLYLRKQNETIETRLRTLEFDDVTVDDGGDKATALTRETWEYRMLDSDTGSPKGEFITIEYESTYQLSVRDGAWIVESLEAREVP